jgi:hypothetical protein
MRYICDARGGRTWFQIESEKEAVDENALMNHAIEKYFLRAREDAQRAYVPTTRAFIEQDIGLAEHLRLAMPMFLTLRDAEGAGLATAMLPPSAAHGDAFTCVIVGHPNADPYPQHGDAIATLASRLGLTLERDLCFPYRR